jgi:hypothetical protein
MAVPDERLEPMFLELSDLGVISDVNKRRRPFFLTDV